MAQFFKIVRRYSLSHYHTFENISHLIWHNQLFQFLNLHDALLILFNIHYQNQIIQDPLKNIGQQDISASVDFTQLANSAIKEGFFIDLFTTQSMFLLSEQSLSMIMDIEKDEERIMEIHKLKQLVMPNQMGDVFKCMVMGKGISPDNFEELSHLNHTL